MPAYLAMPLHCCWHTKGIIRITTRGITLMPSPQVHASLCLVFVPCSNQSHPLWSLPHSHLRSTEHALTSVNTAAPVVASPSSDDHPGGPATPPISSVGTSSSLQASASLPPPDDDHDTHPPCPRQLLRCHFLTGPSASSSSSSRMSTAPRSCTRVQRSSKVSRSQRRGSTRTTYVFPPLKKKTKSFVLLDELSLYH